MKLPTKKSCPSTLFIGLETIGIALPHRNWVGFCVLVQDSPTKTQRNESRIIKRVQTPKECIVQTFWIKLSVTKLVASQTLTAECFLLNLGCTLTVTMLRAFPPAARTQHTFWLQGSLEGALQQMIWILVHFMKWTIVINFTYSFLTQKFYQKFAETHWM